ncbi:PaaI family thioesterase [Caulobacter sp. KR2-114]|uniref:PaaI family thioesterase n=1 Tax=Caulobacter sp. KR2-114 TaxID=3400912 RepID=UPI003C0CE602
MSDHPQSPSGAATDPMWAGDLATRMAHGVPQAAALGFEFVSMQGGVGVLRVPWREDLVGDPDTLVIAGGVVTSLLDHVCGLAVQAGRAQPTPTATLDLRIDYMRPARPRAGITATAECYKYAHAIAFVRATAYDDDPSDPVATAQAAFALTQPIAPAPSKAGDGA